MKAIGLFEAKAQLGRICKQVAAQGEAVVITRRGKPLVRIEPLPSAKSKPVSVWDRRAEYEKKHGWLTEDFTLPPREKQSWRNPLDG